MDSEALGVDGLLDRAAAALGGPVEVVGVAPGRINIIGEHTDTIGGFALPAAIDRHILVALRRTWSEEVVVQALDVGGELRWDVRALPAPEALEAGWERYVVGAVAVFQGALAARGEELPGGFEAVVTGDVPLGSGVSSSAALCLALLDALDAWADTGLAQLELARLAQRVEHDWADVHCGLLDQVASQCSVVGRLALVDFRDLGVHLVENGLSGVHWVLLHTGVSRSLAGSAYEDRLAEVAEGLRRSGLDHWRDLPGPGGMEGLVERVGDERLLRRLRHGITENARVHAAVRAIEAGDAVRLGRILLQSHASLRDDYEVSCPELDELQRLAAGTPGCLGARMMGGGFGGCVLALVEDGGNVSEAALQAYRQRFPGLPSRALQVQIAAGARGWLVEG